MEKIFKKFGIVRRILGFTSNCLMFAVPMLISVMLLTGCVDKKTEEDSWLSEAQLDKEETAQELYEKALKEDVLIVYTVSTRTVDTKESFEAAYPGLYVEIRDLRSPDLITAVENNYQKGTGECDVVICNDNSGEFKARLSDTGVVVPYLPADIREHMAEESADDLVSFVNEAEMLFYNSEKYESCPISNLWELTDEKYEGMIYMPNPLRSFSTYALCAASFEHGDELKEAYEECYGSSYDESMGDPVQYFWTKAAKNIIFTNSSDEVMEAVGNGDADFGILVSSKLRFQKLGYHMEAVYQLTPFSGCRTSYSVMIARNAKNVNTAKLFIRYILGEKDGDGEGYKPFLTEGTWSAREDVQDLSSVPLPDCDFIIPDPDQCISKKEEMESFWSDIIKSE